MERVFYTRRASYIHLFSPFLHQQRYLSASSSILIAFNMDQAIHEVVSSDTLSVRPLARSWNVPRVPFPEEPMEGLHVEKPMLVNNYYLLRKRRCLLVGFWSKNA